MALLAGREYKASVQRMKVNAYLDGKKVEDLLANPITRSVVEATAEIYDLAANPRNEAAMTATSHITGEKINRNRHVNRSTDRMQRLSDMGFFT